MAQSPEVIARQARRELALSAEGPVPDILQRLEQDGGVNVVVARLPEGGPAGAYTVERDTPFILVNSSEPIVRQRFTLAHEYGHHRLGHGDTLDQNIPWDTTDPKETGANRFAAEFLAPVAAVNLWFEAHEAPLVHLETVVRLANDFGVSAEVVLWRIKAAGRVDQLGATRLKKRIDAHEHWGLRRQLGLPPVVDTLSFARSLPVRVPSNMTANVLKAYQADIIDRRTAAERLRIPVTELDKLAENQAGADDD